MAALQDARLAMFRYISEETYSLSHYPTFCHGGMWTVSQQLMQELYSMAEKTNRSGFHLEDVYVTGE